MSDSQVSETYTPGRPIMTRAELAAHKVDAYGRNYAESDDGYSDMEAEASRGWHAISGWGEAGWDLGDWPYLVLSVRHPAGCYELLEVCEGDRTVWRFATKADLYAAVDYLFVWYGLSRGYDEWEVNGLTYDKTDGLEAGLLRVPERFRGPYRATMATQA